MGHRRKSRELALQGLYMHEIAHPPVDELLTLHWIEKEVTDYIREFAVKLIQGVIENQDAIDEIIIKHSKNWKIERLSVIDKVILRISIFSMLWLTDIPVTVTIDEAIELGKLYGGESSSQFINGVLDAIRKTKENGKEPPL